jgi:hypothetical protein
MKEGPDGVGSRHDEHLGTGQRHGLGHGVRVPARKQELVAHDVSGTEDGQHGPIAARSGGRQDGTSGPDQAQPLGREPLALEDVAGGGPSRPATEVLQGGIGRSERNDRRALGEGERMLANGLDHDGLLSAGECTPGRRHAPLWTVTTGR